jgi:ribosomal protein S18 acetylase RimI-like enzyme
MLIRRFDESDRDAVVRLWQRCELTRPWNDPNRDIDRKLTVQPELFLVGEADGVVIASVMAGYDGHRGWLNFLAVDPDHQRRGYARELVAAAEQRLTAIGCPKLNLQVRATNPAVLAFYDAIGYRTDDVVSLGKRLIPD